MFFNNIISTPILSFNGRFQSLEEFMAPFIEISTQPQSNDSN